MERGLDCAELLWRMSVCLIGGAELFDRATLVERRFVWRIMDASGTKSSSISTFEPADDHDDELNLGTIQ